MDYKSLNKLHREKMSRITKDDFFMEWENPVLFDILLGRLPVIRSFNDEKGIEKEIKALKEYYSQYNFFDIDRKNFLKELRKLVINIQKKKSSWYGLDLYSVEESILQQEFCLISGEGGIGKSYFIKCIEEELEKNDIQHLCIYGKFEKDGKNIDVDEIVEKAETGFVFIVDAINEMTEHGQLEILKVLQKLTTLPKIRVIVTYRTNAIDNQILQKYQKLAVSEYSFPGVSFESALNELLKMPIPDIYKYEDILYSNNALQLHILCTALSDKELVDEEKNSVASITFILEHYVKNSIKKTFKGELSNVTPIEIWRDIKNVAKWMYQNDEKRIDKQSLAHIIKTGNVFLKTLRQAGILEEYNNDEGQYYYFAIDSLTDFLIARSLFEDISGKTFEEQVRIISQKTSNLYNMKEAVIIAIFDNLAPNYEYIAKLLKTTGLMDSLEYETLVKINFKKENITNFLEVFNPTDKKKLITIFGGYTDKPFNCVNYLNMYYNAENKQRGELSAVLSGTHFLGRVKGKIKNILYFLTLHNGKDRRVEEAFYYALWCCAAANKDIRCLAMKLLYEVIRQNSEYKTVLIDEYERIYDIYIKESAIYVLANLFQEDEVITSFFRKLICDEKYLTAKSIKRISVYLKDDYGYIRWNRANLYQEKCDVGISDVLDQILFSVEIRNKDFLPFKYWSKEHVEMHTEFLEIDREEIVSLNQYLDEEYPCVKTGECNGWGVFVREIEEKCGINVKKKVLDKDKFFSSLELVVKETFLLYQEPYERFKDMYGGDEFSNSRFLKCVDIAIGLYYGSLMCNYFTDEFATYNNFQNNIGFEVYDPLEYDEEVYITPPIPTFYDYIERLDDIVVSRIDVPQNKDLVWVKDVSLTHKNVMSLLEPVEIKGVQWILLAGRIAISEESKYETRWKDTYNIWCCMSEKESIYTDGNARYLTIELEDYTGNIDDYYSCNLKPWLCKKIKNINYHSKLFDDTSLVLPPASIINYFKLRPKYSNMSWINSDSEEVILCNNNKHSYYTDLIGETVYIRKDFLDMFLQENIIKYFVFTERFIPETGYADETALHFEIQDKLISKEIPNDGGCFHQETEKNPLCNNCPHGFNHTYNNNDYREMFEIFKGEGYIFGEEDEL